MSIKINAAVITSPGSVALRQFETPDLEQNEVLVRVKAVALCTLEQRAFSGMLKAPLPFLGGHEVAGEIAALGSGANRTLLEVGNHVAVRMLYNCGECYYCRSGHGNLCVHAQRKPVRAGLPAGPGGLCDYIIADTTALYRIPDDFSYSEASLTEPLACCVHSVERAGICLGNDVVVIGGGIMGQLHVMLAKRLGARVFLIEPDENRRILGSELGADLCVDAAKEDPFQVVMSITEGRGADVVFNTTAIASVLEQAIAMCGKTGRMVQYSSMHPDVPTLISPQMLHSSEKYLTGSISPTTRDFFTANKLLSSGIISVKRLICTEIPFSESQCAFETAVQPNTLRVIVVEN